MNDSGFKERVESRTYDVVKKVYDSGGSGLRTLDPESRIEV